MYDPIYEEEYHNHHIAIYHDDFAESPRTYDNLGTMRCWHHRYHLGDAHHYDNPHAFLIDLAEWKGDPNVSFQQLYKRIKKRAILLPLFLYDHSGITINTIGFTCPWDSGRLGFIYVTLSDIRREFKRKRISSKFHAQIVKWLNGEVAVYDDYLSGLCYGFIITKNKEEIESCWGFLGSYEDYCLREARASIIV